MGTLATEGGGRRQGIPERGSRAGQAGHNGDMPRPPTGRGSAARHVAPVGVAHSIDTC